MLKFIGKRFIEGLQTGSIVTGAVSTIEVGSQIQDTKFNPENIKSLITEGTLEGCENLKNFICKSVNEIVNITDYLKENYNIPFPEYEDQVIVDIENIKLDITQLVENLDIINDFSPEKIENFFTILVSMGAVSSIFIYLIPKILQNIKTKI